MKKSTRKFAFYGFIALWSTFISMSETAHAQSASNSSDETTKYKEWAEQRKQRYEQKLAAEKQKLNPRGLKTPGASLGAIFFDHAETHELCWYNTIRSRQCRPAQLRGAQVDKIVKDGPIYLAGLRTGDVITKIGVDRYQLKNVNSANQLTNLLQNVFYDGSELFIGFRSPSSDPDKSQLWKRQRFAVAVATSNTIQPTNGSHTLRSNSLEEILTLQENSFYAMRKMTNRPHQEELYIKPYTDSELNKYKTKNSNANKEECIKFGPYPNIPDLSVAKNYVPEDVIIAEQTALNLQSQGVIDDASNAIVSIGNARASLEAVSRTLASARDAFWKSYDNGVNDESLRKEYAYWLRTAKKFDTSGAQGSSAIFAELAGNTTDGVFAYPTGPALAPYQFLKHSVCSPLRSGYIPEVEAGEKWASKLLNLHYDSKFSDFIDYSQELPPSTWDLTKKSGVMDCARWAQTFDSDLDACVAGSSLRLQLLPNGNIMIDSVISTLENTLLEYEDELYSLRFSDKHGSGVHSSCTAEIGRSIIKYFFYTNYNYFDNYNSIFSDEAIRELCKSGQVDLLSDEVDKYIGTLIARGYVNKSYWQDIPLFK